MPATAGSPSVMTSRGTVTFLFSDIEGSTRLLQTLGPAWPRVLEAHGRIPEGAFEAEGGRVFDTSGDGYFAVFETALAAAAAAQRALAGHPWPSGAEVRVRMGLHTGESLVSRSFDDRPLATNDVSRYPFLIPTRRRNSMRIRTTVLAVTAALAAAAGTAHAQDGDIAVANGGIDVPGWQGKIDARAAEAGQTVANARLAMDGDVLHVKTGPAITYWNPANTASGNYTVSATFTEMEYMALNDHPHPYGIVIAGNSMGTGQQSYLYCAANGAGNFIVRGFGPEPFQVNGRRGETHDAVNRAAGKGEPVTQEIAVSVRGDKVECAINGTVVGSYDKSALVTDGMLTSTDGVYGIRFAHNTEGRVTNLRVVQH